MSREPMHMVPDGYDIAIYRCGDDDCKEIHLQGCSLKGVVLTASYATCNGAQPTHNLRMPNDTAGKEAFILRAEDLGYKVYDVTDKDIWDSTLGKVGEEFDLSIEALKKEGVGFPGSGGGTPPRS